MGKIKYDTQANSRSLLYQLDPGEALDTVVKGMLDNNRIPGILQPVFSQVDDDSFFRYDISGLVEFQELLQGGIRLHTLIKIMLGIAEGLDLSQEYLIPGDTFLLEPETIFVDQNDLDVGLICLPVLREDQELSYSEFFLDLMTRNMVNTEQYAQYYPEIINYLNKYRKNFSLRDFCNLLQKDWDEIQVSEGGGSSSVHKEAARTKPNEKKPSVVSDISKFLADRANNNADRNAITPNVNPDRAVGGGQKGPSKKGGLFSSFGDKAKDLLGGDKNKEEKASGGKESKSAGKKPAIGGGFIPGKGKVGGAVNSAPPPAPRPPQPRPAEREQRAADPVSEPNMAEPARKPAQASKPSGLSFGKTVFLSGMSQGTQIIESPRTHQSKDMPVCRLIRESTGEVVNVNQPVLRIGRDRDYADYCIEDNGCVSGQHARLEFRDGQYVLLDTNSSNGTFVNGRRLGAKEVYVLKDKDSIVFGNENFTFQME